ncbi:hypothetical protein [Catenuloplanes indicus]|uniref:Uncharacterized protein n=1 Tax=Catenuloplanes indicus TaxID=137267 RepID=A0AAE3VUK4_9ACTN|nr:hypothetical protein [Catenuloplanes indicus]MDQ0364101.1 hypothetical protein [Catenuloplanes indicus]
MPDFFDRLAERARGVPAADPSWVRPRLPAAFERAPGLEIQEVEVDAPDGRAEPARIPPRVDAPRPVPVPRASEPPAAAAATPPVTVPVSVPVDVPVRPPVLPVPAPVAVTPVESVVERTVRSAGEATDSELAPVAASPVPSRPDFDLAPLAPLAARTVPPVPFDARGTAAEPTAARAPAAAAQPVIRVSIGRLEVSAAPEPPRDERRRPVPRPEPRISLDRYLSDREAP